MALLKMRGNPEAHTGVWHVFQVDQDTGKQVRFLIRPLPEQKEREIGRKHLGRKFETLIKRRGKASVEHDLDKMDAANAEAAEWCWIDSDAFVGLAEDAEAAEEHTKLLGFPVKVGEPFAFDGHLTLNVKRHLIRAHHQLAAWIVDKAKTQQLRAEEDREEEEAGKG